MDLGIANHVQQHEPVNPGCVSERGDGSGPSFLPLRRVDCRVMLY
jgi:hypothetical protein